MIFNIDTYGSRMAIITDDGTQMTYAKLAERVGVRAKEILMTLTVLMTCLLLPCERVKDGTSRILNIWIE